MVTVNLFQLNNHMRASSKKGALFILASFLVAMLASLPMIVNRNDDFLLAGLIMSTTLFVYGVYILIKK